MNSIEKGEKIDRRIADQVAAGMKAWAISKGATHYTHWFLRLPEPQPKSMMPLLIPSKAGKGSRISADSELMQQEPDASSFPSGGIRNTFEARGYTAWDPTSPAFIMDRTLLYPDGFCFLYGRGPRLQDSVAESPACP